MQRKLKFRAWDTSSGHYKPIRVKEMHYFSLLELDESYIIPTGAVIDQDTIIMQYTGLKDKNGKEIFEGDILRITCSCGHQENLPVEWKDGHNGYFARAKWQHNWDNDQLTLKWAERDTEVLGNIYENPEILKETK